MNNGTLGAGSPASYHSDTLCTMNRATPPAMGGTDLHGILTVLGCYLILAE